MKFVAVPLMSLTFMVAFDCSLPIPPHQHFPWFVGAKGGDQSPTLTSPIDITNAPYSADTTGHTDATDAINRACADALISNRGVLVPSGTFAHKDFIYCGVPLIGTGESSVLLSTGSAKTTTSEVYRGSPGYQSAKGVITKNSCGGKGMTVNVTASSAGVVTDISIAEFGTGYTDYCKVYPLEQHAPDDSFVTLGVTPWVSIVLTGRGAQLRNLKVATTWKGGRVNHTASDAVQVRGEDWLIDHVHVVGAPQMGIQGRGAKNGVVQNSLVEDTFSDGIDFSYCSSNDIVSGNQIINTGDDGLSINSYSHDPCPTTHITFINDQIVNSSHGLAIAGGDSITANNISTDGTELPCIQIYSASSVYGGLTPATNVNIRGFHANRCKVAGILINGETSDHNAKNINIDGFVGTNLLGHGIWSYFRKDLGTFVSDVSIKNSSFTAAPNLTGTYQGALIAGVNDLTIEGDTFSGFTGYCVVAMGNNSNAGQFRFEDSNCYSNNMGNTSPYALHINSKTGFSSISVQGDSVRNGPNPLKWFAHFGTETAPITFRGNRGDVVSRIGGTNVR